MLYRLLIVMLGLFCWIATARRGSGAIAVRRE